MLEILFFKASLSRWHGVNGCAMRVSLGVCIVWQDILLIRLREIMAIDVAAKPAEHSMGTAKPLICSIPPPFVCY